MMRKPKPSRTKKPETVIEWVELHSKEYSDHAAMIRACAKDMNVKPESVRTKISSKKKREGNPSGKKKEGISREQFRAQFDKDTGIREAVRKGLEALGNTEIVSDNQFRTERCGNCSTAGWRQVAEEEEFLAHQFRCGSRIWWATKPSVKWTLEHVSKAKGM